MSNISKNLKIKHTLSETKLRRSTKDLKVFQIKVDLSHLSKKKEKKLNSIFLQAKWIYNYILDQENAFDLADSIKSIPVKVFNSKTNKCDIIENRNLTIGSQIKQSVFKQVKQDIINLSKKKTKVGKLKFKKEIKSIKLKQFGVTYKIKNKNYIFLQGVGKIKVSGLKQILKKDDYELSCANLIQKPSGFYFHIVAYIPKVKQEKSGEIGIDMGISSTLTFSDGQKSKNNFPIPQKLKRKQKKLSKKKYGKKNYTKQLKRIRKVYEKHVNKKNDTSNKIFNKLKKYEKIVIQDENLSGWQSGWFGKQVSESILGRIKCRIKTLQTSMVIDRYLPTTQICPSCFKLNKTKLNDRIYSCKCGFSEDRDIKSAKTILCLGNFNKTSKELRGLPAEELAPVFKNYIFEDKLTPVKQEAQ